MTNSFRRTTRRDVTATAEPARSTEAAIIRRTRWRTTVVGLLVVTAVYSGSLHAREEDTWTGASAGLAEVTLPDLGSTPGPNDNPAHDGTDEKYNTGWAFYLDNDVLTTGNRDQDYTGGFAVTLSGYRAMEYPISVGSWLVGLDRFSRFQNLYKDRNHFQRHSLEFGITLFTPSDISVSEPIPDDHPYASLFFIANTEQTVMPEDNVAYQSTLTVGFLGLDIAEDIQESVHDIVGAEKPKGWDNQISAGGEPTAKYTVSRQKTVSRHSGAGGIDHEFKTAMEGNFGFSTDVNVGISWRWGRISTPWWSFNPHQAEYINLGSPVIAKTKQGRRSEFFLWAGGTIKYRFYNAVLQGQFRDSAVTFDRSDLEHVITEVWIGVTKDFSGGLSGSLFIRGRTEEIKGPNKRRPVWGGIILSKAY